MTIQQQETDSPIIPVPQLERLHAFKPEAVDWVLQQTQIEAEERRSALKRINLFTFIERTLGQIFGLVIGLVIGLSGIFGGGYMHFMVSHGWGFDCWCHHRKSGNRVYYWT